jgi:hypothetical protein
LLKGICLLLIGQIKLNGKQFKKHTIMKKMESKKEEMKEMKMSKKAYMAKEMKEGKKSASMTKAGKKMYKK